ncbi:MAG: Rho termination factor N-terminal domain-containing protein, partial [Bacteriovoracaceae bacterium]|nr:Rho termination factor N-terminal domain-containing protein [Bacteriovoracaceae bacterium]
MHLNDLREKDPKDLTKMAEEMKIENPSSMKKHELIFALLKATASKDKEIFGSG